MSNKPDNKSVRKPPVKKPEYNGWRVLAIFIEGVFGLFNSNKIYPAFGMMFFLLAGLIVWKLPDNELALLIKFAIESLATTRGGLVALLAVTNVAWLALYRRSVKIYSQEIDRLSGVRTDLIHGKILPIQQRRSSESEVTEAYVFPAADDTNERARK